ncbi:hypothetical protein GA0074692_6171 [Micromonospora pallida]|uniref:Uncharacterized protein n=1 Tax=Micromonospora pallida TaxID=145854 RepID=A0A1C6THD6_9ACTN|nr:hypothetical protein [Micromonospora pallida]SCL41156.1 hypothetical protein GA0074692_6171 [Micromonospora pallida]
MTSEEETSCRRRTAAALHGTAEQLEVAETILHRSAEEVPNPTTTTRLHALGDEVTAQAQAIDRRADLLVQPGVKHSGARGTAERGTRELDDEPNRVVTGENVVHRPAE